MQRTQEPGILGANSSRADSAQDVVRDKEGHKEQEGNLHSSGGQSQDRA